MLELTIERITAATSPLDADRATCANRLLSGTASPRIPASDCERMLEGWGSPPFLPFNYPSNSPRPIGRPRFDFCGVVTTEFWN
jgi:hypothetical protein